MPIPGQKAAPVPTTTAKAPPPSSPPPAAPRPSPWRPGSFQRRDGEGVLIDKVAGLTYGQVGIHERTVIDSKHWVVTLLTIGMAVVRVTTEADAKRIGEFLWNRYCLALRETTRAAIQAKLPPWVQPWVKAVNEAAAWVDPAPYSTGVVVPTK